MNKELYDAIVKKRGYFCESCGVRIATELHHCIIRRSKRHPEFDCEQNLELLCKFCHSSPGIDSYSHSCDFWRKQVHRGYDMQAWIDSLGLKSKEFYV
jgi:hypothetical protein